MGSDSDPPKNAFERWKQHVDTHVAATLNNLLGIPAIVTKNLNLRRVDDVGGVHDDGGLPEPLSPPPPPSSSDSADNSSSSSADASPPPDVDAYQLLEWHKFAYYSAYSPLRLQQQQRLYGLPPPIPRDVPYGADPYAFTYADAFEDLLCAASGRPLLDLSLRSYRNLQHQMRYGTAAEPPYVFFHRLHTQKLLDAYFPRGALPASASSVDGSKPAHTAADMPNDAAVQAVEEAEAETLVQRTGDVWRRDRDAEAESRALEQYRTNDEGNDPSARFPNHRRPPYGQGGLFDELDRVFRVLGRIVDEDVNGNAKGGDKHGNDNDAQPSAEDELYQMVRSAYSDAEKSLSTLIKTFASDFPPVSSSVSSSASATTVPESKTITTRGSDDDDYETVQTTDEHVDAWGNRHVKTVVRRLDKEGNEVARETRYTMRSASVEEREKAAEAKEDQKDSSSSNNKSGWFWK